MSDNPTTNYKGEKDLKVRYKMNTKKAGEDRAHVRADEGADADGGEGVKKEEEEVVRVTWDDVAYKAGTEPVHQEHPKEQSQARPSRASLQTQY